MASTVEVPTSLKLIVSPDKTAIDEGLKRYETGSPESVSYTHLTLPTTSPV